MLNSTIIDTDCAGKSLMDLRLLAPKYWDIIEDIALLDWPKIQINIDIKEPTIPVAASDWTGYCFIFPIIAVSVIDIRGSVIPASNAGIANLLRFLNDNSLVNVFFGKRNFRIMNFQD